VKPLGVRGLKCFRCRIDLSVEWRSREKGLIGRSPEWGVCYKAISREKQKVLGELNSVNARPRKREAALRTVYRLRASLRWWLRRNSQELGRQHTRQTVL
jgi:hypothetical protein